MRTVFAVGLLMLVGCLGKLPEKIWMDQYKGLAQLPNPEQRMNVLAQITESAAYAGDAAAVKRFLKDFRDDPRHDDLAARCAKHLANKELADGEKIADLIVNDNQRNATLFEIRPKKEAAEEAKPEAKAGKP
jgi:hypothetical protein